jgi:predicted dehydrogenase
MTAPSLIDREHALLVLEAGKHVLVEKPVGCSAGDARAIHEKVKTQ